MKRGILFFRIFFCFMKSQYADKFNHDSIACEYDENVQDENNPVRAGYQALLAWIQEKAQYSRVIVDLGCGTGNTIQALQNFEKVI